MGQNLQQPEVTGTAVESIVGLDLGDRWSRYCAVNHGGEVVEEDRVRTTAVALEQRFKQKRATRMVIEAGTHSPWVSRLLESYGHEVVVANARKVRLIYESDCKNDKLDARMLARLGRADVNLLSPIRHRRAETQVDLTVLRSRDALVAARVKLVNAERGMVKSVGGRLPKSTTSAFAGKMVPLIPPELKEATEPLLESIGALTKQIQRSQLGQTRSGLHPRGQLTAGDRCYSDRITGNPESIRVPRIPSALLTAQG